MYHFCTYFDSNYLTQGIALYRSLQRHVDHFRLYVLCLDEVTFRFFENWGNSSLVPVSLNDLEGADAELFEVKGTRSKIEYYFTITPSFIKYILDFFPGIDVLSYLDADLFFYASPVPIYEELGNQSVLILEHRYPEHLRFLEKFGIYNVGFLSFRNDEFGKRCLNWWRERCLEWCYDRLEDGRYGDQKYLEDWPILFDQVVVLQNLGAGLATWNMQQYEFQEKDGKVLVDDEELIFCHFHKLSIITSNLYESEILYVSPYYKLDETLLKVVYKPYLQELSDILTEERLEITANIRERVSPRNPNRLLRSLIHGKLFILFGSKIHQIRPAPAIYPLILLFKRVFT